MRNFFNKKKKNKNTLDGEADTRQSDLINLKSPKFSIGDTVFLKEEVSGEGLKIPVNSPCLVFIRDSGNPAPETIYILCYEPSGDDLEEPCLIFPLAENKLI